MMGKAVPSSEWIRLMRKVTGATTHVVGKQHYVAGFLFDETTEYVALIEKQKGPESVRGRWNGIGGKVEHGEDSLTAMRREFLEETNVDIAEGNWGFFMRLEGEGWLVDFYHAFDSDKLNRVMTAEEEQVRIFRVSTMPKVVPNLRWIIPMALGHDADHVHAYRVIEDKFW